MTNESHPGVLGSLWRYRQMAAFIVAGVVIVSLVAGVIIAPSAQASATIALAAPPSNSVVASGITGDASLARYTAQRANFVTSDAVLQQVAEDLGRDDITGLRRSISASPSATANTIVVTAEGSDGADAAELAGAVVAAYREESAREVERLTQAAIESIDVSAQEILDSLEAGPDSAALTSSAASTLSQLDINASEIRTSSALFGDGVEFVVEPRADAATLPGLPLREGALGLVLGLVIAATAAWMRADREIATAGAAARRRASVTVSDMDTDLDAAFDADLDAERETAFDAELDAEREAAFDAELDADPDGTFDSDVDADPDGALDTELDADPRVGGQRWRRSQTR